MNKTCFLDAINTLKLYRRAELMDDEGERLIEDLYEDPLPDQHVLRTLMRPNTTFLIGRKGTGKSTIFQMAQKQLDSDKKVTWAYIDIKTLFESSTSELLGNVPVDEKGALSAVAVRKIAIFNNFLLELVKEIRRQITERIAASIWETVKDQFMGSTVELFDKLDEFIREIEENKYINITGSVLTSSSDVESEKSISKTSSETSATIDGKIALSLKDIVALVSEIERSRTQNYSEVYLRVFNIRGLISRLREILARLKLRHIYIFIDDFSELPRNDMDEIVGTILAPFNNWSDEFIKLKVAVYPGRLSLGAIDRSKVDEVYLDIYRAYGRNDVAGMEERAIDFTKRLLGRRLTHFCGVGISGFFEKDEEEMWRTLFFCCLGNPRILGYILYYCYEADLIYNRKIGIKAIKDAARRYYEEKIEEYFRINKFLHETFEERSSIFSLKELLEEVVKRAKMLRAYKGSKIMSELPGRPPTSHFHVVSDYDSVISTLELNFFITKYYEMKDRDGRDVSVYALNYGLCQQQAITFGRPQEKREHRLYFVERIFDYSPIIATYIKINQEIVCESCGRKHPSEALAAIQKFDMLCPSCKVGHCKVVNLSRKYENLIKSVRDENLLPEAELGILKTLHDERRTMFAKEIAAELDCSYQLIGRRGKNLAQRDLVTRDENDQGRRVFEIKEKADSIYFEDVDEDRMDFGEIADAEENES